MNPDLCLTQINIFPLKSAAKISLQSTRLDRFGLSGDRRWMVVDRSGEFMTGRRFPALLRIGVLSLEEGLVLQALGSNDLQVDKPDSSIASSSVTVWDDRVEAQDCGDEAAHWLSEVLSVPCRLIYMGAHVNRQVDENYASKGVVTSFADGFPLLLIGEASLIDLNERLADPVSMDRFRPNLVVSTEDPFVEDRWRKIRIGQIELSLVKPCGRCIMVTVNPETGLTGKEPLKTLASYRRQGGEVMFGQNALHHNEGGMQLGDSVEVLEWAK